MFGALAFVLLFFLRTDPLVVAERSSSLSLPCGLSFVSAGATKHLSNSEGLRTVDHSARVSMTGAARCVN